MSNPSGTRDISQLVFEVFVFLVLTVLLLSEALPMLSLASVDVWASVWGEEPAYKGVWIALPVMAALISGTLAGYWLYLYRSLRERANEALGGEVLPSTAFVAAFVVTLSIVPVLALLGLITWIHRKQGPLNPEPQQE